MRIVQVAIGGALTLALNTPGLAQDSEEHHDHEEDRIVITGTAIETARDETLQSVEVLSLNDVIDSFDGSLGASLSDLPGLSTTGFGPAVGRPIIRGLGGDRVRILNNGVGLIDASTLSVDHAGTSEVLDAERIDILRGPAAIAYGGGAIGGVINVVDGRIASRPVDGLFDGQAYAGYTSVDEGSQFAGRASTGIGPFVIQIEGSHREAGDASIPGFAESGILRANEEEEGEGHEDEEEAFGTVENSDFTFDTLGGGVSVVGDWGFFGVAVRDYDAEYGLPGHGHGHEEEEEEDEDHEDEEGDARLVMEQTRWDARGRFALGLGPYDHVDFSAGYADYEHVELEPSGEAGTTFTNDGWEARAALVDDGHDAWSGSLGVQVLQSDFAAFGEEAFVPPVETTDIGLFVAERYDAERHGFEAGARLETRDLEATGGPDRSFTTFSVSGGAFMRPTENSFLGVSLTRTERAPTGTELYSNGPHAATSTVEIGDPNLDIETGWALDGTYRYQHNGLLVEVGAFVSYFQDFIYLSPTGLTDPDEELPIFQYVQDDATLYGGELFVQGPLGALAGWDVYGDATFEYVRGETDNFGDLPRMPPFSAILGIDFERSFIDLRGEAAFTAQQDDIAPLELPTDNFVFLNFSASAHPFGNEGVRVLFEILNATDEEGRVHTSQLKDLVPLPGRSFRIGLHATF